MDAAALVREGRPAEALGALEKQVRAEPAEPKHRVFLFQLLCVLGQWQRAADQLRVASEMDDANALLANAYAAAIRCELFRTDVFAGKRGPLVFGEPEPWLGDLIQALGALAQGNTGAAAELRDRAFDAAPGVGGLLRVGDAPPEPFEWLADADSRLGPVLELFVDGRYYWVPATRVRTLILEAPEDLRDLVWLPGTAIWTNGGESAVMMPARYPIAESDDEALLTARRTDWAEPVEGYAVGRGQRMLVTDSADHPILEIRELAFANDQTEDAEGG